MNLGLYFVSEVVGTAMLVLLGCGVVANVALAKTKGAGGGFLLVNVGWGLALFAGVLVSAYSGGQLNPAVSLALLVRDSISPAQFAVAILGQMVGAAIGAVLVWLAYRQHFDQEPDPGNKLGVFATGPGIRSAGWNLITELIGTFVLVFVILSFRDFPSVRLGALTALGPALVFLGIGASLGGPTGYAVNPARDLAPRIIHAVLPIRGKGPSDWGYARIPVVGPLLGGALAALASNVLLGLG